MKSGLVSVGGADDYESQFEPFVVPAAAGGPVIDIGAAVVAVAKLGCGAARSGRWAEDDDGFGRPWESVGVDYGGSGMMRDTYSWRGYRNFARLFGAAAVSVLLAAGMLLAVPGLRYGEAAGTGAVAVALIVAFGLGYALDASPRRVELYGRSRERAAARLVLGFFLIAVTTLGSLVAYQLWPPGYEVPLALCRLGTVDCGRLPRAVDLGPWFAGYGVLGLAMTLAGAAQLFVAMYNPPRLDPQSTTVEVVGRRLGARAIDATFLMGGVWVVLSLFGSVRVGTPEAWVLTGGLVLGAFLYEAAPLTWARGRTLGKLVWRLQVVDARSGETAPKLHALGRALVTSLVYSLGSTALLLLSLGRDVDRTIGWQLAAGLVLVVSPLMHVRGQGLHDAAFGTQVVRSRSGASRKVPADSGKTASSPTESRLRPPDPTDSTDLLDRRTQVEIVCGVLRSEAGPAVVTVDAPWGGGKTTFLRMCATELRGTDGVLVVEFNSWTQQYTKKPLVDLVGAISHQLRTGEKGGSDSDLRDQAEPLAEVFGNARTNRPLFTSWESTHESVRGFSTALREVAAGQGRVVLVVDELDRCQPSYALGVLEALHHLFAVEGVVAVVGVSRDELCNSIWSLYGEKFDTDTYLRRFTDLGIDLPPPTYENLSRFMGRQLHTSGLADHIQTRSATILQLVGQIEGCSLRDLQQATHFAALALLPDPPAEHPRIVWEQSVVAMIVLRAADQAAYRQFARREIDSFTALAAANTRLQPPRAGADSTQAIPRTWFEAALLNVEPAESLDSASFKQRYRHAHRLAGFDLDREEPFAGTDQGADLTLDALYQLRHAYPPEHAAPHGWKPLRVELMTDRLDLLAE